MSTPMVTALRSIVEEMLDSRRTVDTEEKEMPSDDTLENLPPPLPLRPKSRARLLSNVRAKKQISASMDSLALPSKVSAAVLKKNIALDSIIANLVLTPDPATLATKSSVCFTKSIDSTATFGKKSGLASENEHTPLAKREVANNNMAVPHPQSVTYPSVLPPVVPSAEVRESEGGTAQLRTGEAPSDGGSEGVIINSGAQDCAHEQPSFGFLAAEECPPP